MPALFIQTRDGHVSIIRDLTQKQVDNAVLQGPAKRIRGLSDKELEKMLADVLVTPEMIDAGAVAIREEIGDPMDVSGWFTADGLADKVYRAMALLRPPEHR